MIAGCNNPRPKQPRLVCLGEKSERKKEATEGMGRG